MKNHLKRIASPRTWILDKKYSKYTVKPNPGAHALDSGLPLGVILRDILKIADSMTEVKKILNSKEVLVDGRRRKDHRFQVGLFDVLSIPDLKQNYRIVLDVKGRLSVLEIESKESSIKICKINGKTVLSKGKIQFNLSDGKNIISDMQAKLGDSLVVSLPEFKVKEVLPLKAGAVECIVKGKKSGRLGTIKELKKKEVVFGSKNKAAETETTKNCLFVLGFNEPKIKVEL